MEFTDDRGYRILEMVTRLSLNVVNVDNSTTLTTWKIIPYITLASEAFGLNSLHCRVIEGYRTG